MHYGTCKQIRDIFINQHQIWNRHWFILLAQNVFLSDTGIDEIVSETTGLIAPPWHYAGVAGFDPNSYTE